MAEIVLFGIPNCDTVKKARRWLDQHDIAYVFHNFKKDGVPASELSHWADTLGLDLLVNRRGTTWRKLDEVQKAIIDNGGAAALTLLMSEASMIKRPVLQTTEHLLIGFNDAQWTELLSL